MFEANEQVRGLLRRTSVEVQPETFFLIKLNDEEWKRLLENPELSPRADSLFMFLRDRYEITLLVDETDWRTMRHLLRDAKVESPFRMITFDIELDWNVVGFLANVSDILARAGVSVGALSAFSRDHLLIKQDELGIALRALGEHVAELC